MFPLVAWLLALMAEASLVFQLVVSLVRLAETVHLPSFSCILHPITTEIAISYDCVDKQFKFELYIQLTSFLLNRQLLSFCFCH